MGTKWTQISGCFDKNGKVPHPKHVHLTSYAPRYPLKALMRLPVTVTCDMVISDKLKTAALEPVRTAEGENRDMAPQVTWSDPFAS